MPLIQKLNEYCSILNPLCQKNDDWQKSLYQNTIVASYNFVGDNNFDMVLLLDFSNYGEPDFQNQLSVIKANGDERSFKGEKFMKSVFRMEKN